MYQRNSPASPVWRCVINKRYMYTVRGKTRLGSRDEWRDWDSEGEREWFLYDRLSDPHQLTNRVTDPALEDIKRILRIELAHWLSKAEIPFLETWFSTHPQTDAWLDEHDGRGIEGAFDLWQYVPRSPETLTVSAHAQFDGLGGAIVTLSAAGIGDLPGTHYDILFTTDGSPPTRDAVELLEAKRKTNGIRYKGPLSFGPSDVDDTVIQAVAYDQNNNSSDIAMFRLGDLLNTAR
jgi:hypothetical protein